MSGSKSNSGDSGLDPLFSGPGELATLMRAKDWSATSLGPPAGWDRSLRTVVRIMLTSRYAMWMGWGPELNFFYNDAYRPTLGAKHPWALGQPARQVWAEIWPAIGPRIDTVLQRGEATWDEGLLLFLERNGYPEETYHTFSYSPLPDDAGGTGGMLCVVTEETDRILGERRLAVLRDLASRLAATNSTEEVFAALESCLGDSAPDLPFSLTYLFEDGGRRARLVSRTGIPAHHPAAAALVELADPARRWPFPEIVAPSTAPILTALDQALPWPRGSWPRAPDKALLVPISEQGHTRPAGVFIAGLNVHRPVDEAYRAFIRLFVGQLTAGLANARAYESERHRAEALAEIDRAKTMFFSNVSHEFRTPLTLMLGPIQDALAERERWSPEDAARWELLHRNGLRLSRLVNALLDFARIEAGRLEASYEPTDLAALTGDLASAFRSAIERAGLQLKVETATDPVTSYVDREMWEKIVLNLLSNALKFTFAGEIAVTLRFDGDHAALTVADTGVGVAAEELPRLFERFYRVRGTASRTHEGSGIGLALVQELVRLHGGTVVAASTLGQGTTFTVRIPNGGPHLFTRPSGGGNTPVATALGTQPFVDEALGWLPPSRAGADAGVATAPAVVPARPDARPATAARILLADDNADMRQYVARILGETWQVETVADGEAALRSARARRPDLVLSDVMMPRLDGFGLLRALRDDPATADLPIILLSARAGEDATLEGLGEGANDYLVKPFTSRELVARVAAQLERTHAQKAIKEGLEQARATEHHLRQAAEEGSRAKDQFLAMLGHELRNPLAPIVTALHLMRLRGNDQTEKERTVIERQVSHLTRLVDDLLDVSRITQGKVELKMKTVELRETVARAIEIAGPIIEERQHRLTLDVPQRRLAVRADPVRLAQVIANLLTNAAKYTGVQGAITVTARREDAQVVLRVRDNGIGIAAAMLPRVFDLFAQEWQASDRSHGGLGLGLSIVRNLVALHGGTVEAHSEGLGCGSEFVVRLPALIGEDSVDDQPAGPARGDARARGGRNILVVDDNEDVAEMLAQLLEHLGHVVRVAHDGPAALALPDDFIPDLALLDIGLPVMDGYELARRLRERPALKNLTLVAVTGYGQESDRRLSREAGFDAHLVKPIDPGRLEAIVKQLTDPAAGKRSI